MKSNNIARIIEEYTGRWRRDEIESEKKKFEVHARFPEIFDIDRELSLTSVSIMSAAMSGVDVENKINDLKKRTTELRKRRDDILVANGFPADYTDIHYECKECSDTGYVGLNMCQCLKRAVTLAAFEDSGIGDLVETQNFDNFSLDFYEGKNRLYMEANLHILKEFAKEFEPKKSCNYILMGKTGLGKTHLSTAVAKVVIEKGFRVVYDSVNNIMSDFQEQRFRGTVSEDEISSRYYECDLLIIDDLGCEVANQFTISCIYNLLNSRINNRRSTIISTNLTGAELREKYDDRITSRIFGEFKPVIFEGNDVRAQKLIK